MTAWQEANAYCPGDFPVRLLPDLHPAVWPTFARRLRGRAKFLPYPFPLLGCCAELGLLGGRGAYCRDNYTARQWSGFVRHKLFPPSPILTCSPVIRLCATMKIVGQELRPDGKNGAVHHYRLSTHRRDRNGEMSS
jgi:hypothetical protein